MSKRSCTLETLEDRRLLSWAQLDPNFGDNGVAVFPHAVDMESFQALAQQPDGKILAAGNHFGFQLGRFLADGSLDTDFGVDGYADFGYGEFSGLDVIRIQSDGKIVVAGNDEYTATCGHSDVFVARLNSDGSFDSSFGTGGKVRANYYPDSPCSASSIDSVSDMIVLSDGRILVAGGAVPVNSDANNPKNDFALLRLNADGTYDTSFGDGGKVVTGGGDAIIAVALLPDGKVLAAGNAFSDDGYDIALLRYNADGSLDDSFGTGGKVIVDLSSSDTVKAMNVLSDGRILVAGQLHDTGFLARFLSDGSLDATFGGVARTGWITPADNFTPSDMQVDQGGHITLADASKLRIARYYADGLPVYTLSPNGIGPSESIPDYSGTPYVPAMLLVPGGVLVAGAVSTSIGGQDPFIARFNDGGVWHAVDLSMTLSADSIPSIPVGSFQGFAVRVYNNSDADLATMPIGPFGEAIMMQFYLSRDDRLSPDDLEVLQTQGLFRHGIAANSSAIPEAVTWFEVPPNVLVNNKPTRYTLIGRVNIPPIARTIDETSYDNNIAIGPSLTFVPAKVDLQLSIASLPKFFSRSDPNAVSLIIKNLGNTKASGRALLRFFHTHDRRIIPALAKAFASQRQNLSLEPGQSKRITLSLRSGGGWSTRDFLYVTMDWKGNLPDQKPGNNSVFSATRIRFL